MAVCTVWGEKRERERQKPLLTENPLVFKMIRAAQAGTGQEHPAALERWWTRHQTPNKAAGRAALNARRELATQCPARRTDTPDLGCWLVVPTTTT